MYDQESATTKSRTNLDNAKATRFELGQTTVGLHKRFKTLLQCALFRAIMYRNA